MRIRTTTRHESVKSVWAHRGLSLFCGSALLILVGCADKTIQEHFPEPEYASRQVTVVAAEDADIQPAITPKDYNTIVFYTAYGPELLSRTLEEHAAKGLDLVMILPVIEEYRQAGISYTAGLFLIFVRDGEPPPTPPAHDSP